MILDGFQILGQIRTTQELIINQVLDHRTEILESWIGFQILQRKYLESWILQRILDPNTVLPVNLRLEFISIYESIQFLRIYSCRQKTYRTHYWFHIVIENLWIYHDQILEFSFLVPTNSPRLLTDNFSGLTFFMKTTFEIM